jgi:general secretion pathway protein D
MISAYFFTLRRVTLLALCLVFLGGCAAQQAYQAGRDLITQDKVESALDKFRQAAALEPQNPVFRQAVLQTRERAAYQFNEQADRARANGNKTEAEKSYRRALAIDASDERAKNGLVWLEMDQRHTQLLNDATSAWEKKDIDGARSRLR